MRYRAQQDGKF